jgi:predicted metal-binding membrane protein
MPPPPQAGITLPQRQRMAVWAALLGVAALAWIYLIRMAAAMAMPMDAPLAGVRPWTSGDFLMMFLMWTVMMVGMMLPSAIPMTLIYAGVARQAENQGQYVAPTVLFVNGYLLVWTAFSLAATLLQWALDQAALLSPMMVASSPALGAGILIVAGLYQFTPSKNACLDHCRAPARFISEHWRAGPSGGVRMGLHHGAYCLGCCWALMLLLFFGGVMNLLWIAAITLFVLLEKVLPAGAKGGRWTGVAMVAAGVVALFRPW